ncbi:MAG: aminomethyltransferase family protein [Actinomycetota bacterium]|nr:aminomethyltransferase family protein [Actinomycetota bacterium]MDA3016191.1 aminomethyltransferase family protein [Actinomycetota bacterium]
MTSSTSRLAGFRFAVKAIEQTTRRPTEFARSMLPHPLSYQELVHDPEYMLYNSRLTPSAFVDVSDDEMYWKVRREVILRHTGELPIEIVGPDAERLLNRVFARDVSKVRVGRCSYQFACYHDGGLINDGVLLRLAEDRFWMAQADGDLLNWYRAHAVNDDGSPMDVQVFDPAVWVSQVQGPRSLEVLDAVIDGPMPERFNYFDMAEVSIAGQPVVIGRSGFTNELGWEFYLTPDIDIAAVGDHILAVGEPFGMIITASGVFRARRIEAGLLNAGSDFDGTTTPFAAGLGGFVDFDKGDFIGRAALLDADRSCRTWGLRTNDGVADLGDTVFVSDGSVERRPVGRVCSSGWSPYQQCGVAIVRLDDADLRPGAAVDVVCADGEVRSGELCPLPMYDPERLIPRGKLVDIPEIR